MSSKTGDNVDESMSALVTEVIKKETDIKVVDVSPDVDGNMDDYDDAKETGASFWTGHGSCGWSASAAVASKTLPQLNELKGYKITFLGAEKIGAKTSFIKRYTQNTFNPAYEPTIGVDFATHTETYQGKNIKLMLWDTAGQERFAAIVKSYLNGCLGVVIGYDITKRSSLDLVRRDYATYWKNYPYTTIMVIGNKLDLEEEREVSTEEGEALARELHASLFFEGKT